MEGKQYVVHLARVTDRNPYLLPLARWVQEQSQKQNSATEELRVVVKARPDLLHYLVNGSLLCTIRSMVPITSIEEHCSVNMDKDPIPQTLVVTVDGSIWLVKLPTEQHADVLQHVVLQHAASRPTTVNEDSFSSILTPTQTFDTQEESPISTHASSKDESCGELNRSRCSAEWVYRIPGAQHIQSIPAATVCTSWLAPTTLVANFTPGGASNSIEFDEIEGEQSTCLLLLDGRDQKYQSLLRKLFPDSQVATQLVLLQGDMDGAVRFTVVDAMQPTNECNAKCGKLLELGQPVQSIVPFAIHADTDVDSLLILGILGRIAVINITSEQPVESYPLDTICLDAGVVIQSIVYVDILACFIYCTSGQVYVFRATELLHSINEVTRHLSEKLIDPANSKFSTKLPFRPDVLRIAMHGDSNGLSLLFASGRVSTLDRRSLSDIITRSLPTLEEPRSQQKEPITKNGTEERVKSLLHQIADVSSQSASFQVQSRELDLLLQNLHSAFLFQKQIEATGIASVVNSAITMSLVGIGSFAESDTVKIHCRLQMHESVSLMLSNWSVLIIVRSRHQVLATYSYPLEDPRTMMLNGDKSIILDGDTLRRQEHGMLHVSCSLIFLPSSPDPENRNYVHDSVAHSNIRFFPLSIPLIQDQKLCLVQLRCPLDEEIRTSHLAIRTNFRQDHDTSLPNVSESVLISGFQWWSSLVAHWMNRSFHLYGLALSKHSGQNLLELSPPLRSTVTILSLSKRKFDTDDMMALLQLIMKFRSSEFDDVRRNVRVQNEKMWCGWKSYAGNVVILRFALSDRPLNASDVADPERPVEITIQCSDAADLSAIRILIIDAVASFSPETQLSASLVEEIFAQMSLGTGRFIDDIIGLEQVIEELIVKTNRNLISATSSMCTDEVVHLLSELAHAETQTVDLYWKIRQVLNKLVM